MIDEFSRSELLLGINGVEKLKNSKVIVFGVGGVGSYVVEALARSAVGTIAIVDNDTVSLTNINRQLPASQKTVGKLKVDVVADHIKEINPCCNVIKIPKFFLPENADEINLDDYDYVVDAIDTVSAKLFLAEYCYDKKIKIMSSMGAGNKLDPTKFEVTDIYKTSVCPLAKVMRRELKKRGVKKLKVVFSTEESIKPFDINEEQTNKRAVAGSVAFVPSVAGLIIAGEVIKDIALN